uniref:RING-type domain-containing protein n=1 Tax=Macrostomum lignano TaxID=282301 RepID=A0A1I8JAF5_9PLAT
MEQFKERLSVDSLRNRQIAELAEKPAKNLHMALIRDLVAEDLMSSSISFLERSRDSRTVKEVFNRLVESRYKDSQQKLSLTEILGCLKTAEDDWARYIKFLQTTLASIFSSAKGIESLDSQTAHLLHFIFPNCDESVVNKSVARVITERAKGSAGSVHDESSIQKIQSALTNEGYDEKTIDQTVQILFRNPEVAAKNIDELIEQATDLAGKVEKDFISQAEKQRESNWKTADQDLIAAQIGNLPAHEAFRKLWKIYLHNIHSSHSDFLSFYDSLKKNELQKFVEGFLADAENMQNNNFLWISSDRSGMGKSLLCENISAWRGCPKPLVFCCSGAHLSADELYQFFLNSANEDSPVFFHLDIAREVQTGFDSCITQLAIFGAIVNSNGFVWRRKPKDLYLLEHSENKRVASRFQKSVFCSDLVERDLPGFKDFVLRLLLLMSKDFSTRSIDCSDESGASGADKEESVSAFQLRRHWEQEPHPYLLFNEDGQSFTFFGFTIDKQGNLVDSNTGQVLQKEMIKRQLRDGLVAQQVPINEKFDDLSRAEKISRMRMVFGFAESRDFQDPDKSYELTMDNVKKILAIYMRFRSKIPVVLMGETGCGKTKLVEFLARIIQPKFDSKAIRPENMRVLKVHGGVTLDDIEKAVSDAEKLSEENYEKPIGQRSRYTILFFDEVNTTSFVGLIKEIMLDGRINGRKINFESGLRCVAACNPYRKHPISTINRLENSGLGYRVRREETQDKFGDIPMRHLVYRVKPLPLSLTCVLWDFGNLSEEAEEKYIERMISSRLENMISYVEKQKLTTVISVAQKFMRQMNDETKYVSLREVEREIQLFHWILCGDLIHFVPVVVLDEIGLAEDSPKMPLKVLHPLLEDGVLVSSEVGDSVSQRLCRKVGFVGISNWALDPAKMNRGLYLLRDVPTHEDLIETAKGICKKRVEPIGKYLEPLTRFYLKIFCEPNIEREFFGLRDYFSLLKYLLKESQERRVIGDNQVAKALLRNFSGLDKFDPVQFYCSTNGSIQADLDDYSPLSDALHSTGPDQRYLLLIAENYSGVKLLKQLLSNVELKIIFGSSFPKDQEYTTVCKTINRIKICMERGSTIVLMNLEALYESLYDVLNLCYEESSGNRFVDLGLGTHRLKSRVNANFRIIVVADDRTVNEKFPIPLINRLEKHKLTSQALMYPQKREFCAKQRTWAEGFSQGEKLAGVFVGFHEDMIPSLSLEVDASENNLQDRMLAVATPDSLLRVKDDNERKHLLQQYFKISGQSEFLRKIEPFLQIALQKKEKSDQQNPYGYEPKAWLTKIAASSKSVLEAGTLIESIWRMLKQKVAPALACLLAFLDKDSNLENYVNLDTRDLWLQLLEPASAFDDATDQLMNEQLEVNRVEATFCAFIKIFEQKKLSLNTAMGRSEWIDLFEKSQAIISRLLHRHRKSDMAQRWDKVICVVLFLRNVSAPFDKDKLNESSIKPIRLWNSLLKNPDLSFKKTGGIRLVENFLEEANKDLTEKISGTSTCSKCEKRKDRLTLLPCNDRICGDCLPKSSADDDATSKCPKCKQEFDPAAINSARPEALDKFKARCNVFMLELVSQLCFKTDVPAGNSPEQPHPEVPDEELCRHLLTYVTRNSSEATVFGFFSDDRDPSPVFRSFILQQLLKFNHDKVKPGDFDQESSVIALAAVNWENIIRNSPMEVNRNQLQHCLDSIETLMKPETKELAKTLRAVELNSFEGHQTKSLLIHFYFCLLTSKGKSDFTEFLSQLAKHRYDWYLPAMPHDELFEAFNAVGLNERLGAYVCPNGHPYYIGECTRPWGTSTCLDCGSTIGGHVHRPAKGNQKFKSIDRTKKDFVALESGSTGPEAVRELSGCSVALLRLIQSLALMKDNQKDSVQEFKTGLRLFTGSTGRSEEDAYHTLHLVLEKKLRKSTEKSGFDLTKDQERRAFENRMYASLLQPILDNLDDHLRESNKSVSQDDSGTASEIVKLIHETSERDTNDPQAPLWRFRRIITVENARQAFQELGGNERGQYRLTDAIIKWEPVLRNVKELPVLVNMANELVSAWKRNKELDTSVTQKISAARTRSRNPDAYKVFIRVWNELRHLLATRGVRFSNGDAGTIEKHSLKANLGFPLAALLPHKGPWGRCIIGLVQLLVDAHNAVMEASGIELDEVDLPSVDAASVIEFDPDEDLLPMLLANCTYSLRKGEGCKVSYNFHGLEQQLLERLVRGRVQIGGFLQEMVYKEEFNLLEFFEQLERVVPQAKEVKDSQTQNALNSRLATPVITALLEESLKVAVNFLISLRYKPDPQMLLHEFMTSSLRMEDGLPSESLRRNVAVEHIRLLWLSLDHHLWQYLADDGFEPSKFDGSEPLSPELQKTLPTDLKDRRSILMEKLHALVKLEMCSQPKVREMPLNQISDCYPDYKVFDDWHESLYCKHAGEIWMHLHQLALE